MGWLAGSVAAAAILLVGSGDLVVQAGEPQLAVRSVAAVGMAADALLASGRASLDDKRLALAALNRSPAHPAALRALAAAEQAWPRKRLLLDAAAAWGWREPGTQVALLGAALRQGDDAAAARHADALLRQRAAGGDALMGFLWRRAAQPSFRHEIARRLSYRPAWRTDFLQQRSGLRGASDATIADLARDLRAVGAPLSRTEAAPLLTAMVLDGRIAGAHGIWREQLAAEVPARDVVAWPSPGAIADPTPFDWRISRGLSGLVSVEGREMKVTAAPAVQGLLAERLIVLPPGRYRFLLRGTDLGPGIRLDWAGSCTAPPHAPVRRAGDADFTVPAGCGATRLQVSVSVEAGLASGELRLESPVLLRIL